MGKIGLYIHIPFCEKKCHYCDFTSVKGDNRLINNYVDALIKEIHLYSSYSKDYIVDTIFIGGGTPSAIKGDHIKSIMSNIFNIFQIHEDCEISIEVNPGTMDNEKMNLYKEAGINRVSLGIQSMNDGLLRLLGRIHKRDDVVETVRIIKSVGISNINGDIMFGLPYQSVDEFLNTLREVIDLNLSHISMYGLIIEEGTLMNHWYKRGLISIPNEDDERSMYHKGIKYMKDYGFYQYEISNFAKENLECKHNIGYWKLKPYIGFGISAHSNIHGRRYWNHSVFKDYFKSIDGNELPISDGEEIDEKTKIAEYLILGLRMNNGVMKDEFFDIFGFKVDELFHSQIEKNTKLGLLVNLEDRIHLTERGRDISNQVEIDFLP